MRIVVVNEEEEGLLGAQLQPLEDARVRLLAAALDAPDGPRVVAVLVVVGQEAVGEAEDRVHVDVRDEARCLVAVAPQQLRQGGLLQGQGLLDGEGQRAAGGALPRRPAHATVEAVHRRVEAGEEAREGGRGPGRLADRLLEDDALVGQRVEVGGGRARVAVGAEVVGPQGIDRNQEHVRGVGRRRTTGQPRLRLLQRGDPRGVAGVVLPRGVERPPHEIVRLGSPSHLKVGPADVVEQVRVRGLLPQGGLQQPDPALAVRLVGRAHEKQTEVVQRRGVVRTLLQGCFVLDARLVLAPQTLERGGPAPEHVGRQLRVDGRETLEHRQRFSVPPEDHQPVPKVAKRVRGPGIDLEGPLELGNGGGDLASAREQRSPQLVGCGELSVALGNVADGRERIFHALLTGVDHGDLQLGGQMLRVDLPSLLVLRQRLLELVLCQVRGPRLTVDVRRRGAFVAATLREDARQKDQGEPDGSASAICAVHAIRSNAVPGTNSPLPCPLARAGLAQRGTQGLDLAWARRGRPWSSCTV